MHLLTLCLIPILTAILNRFRGGGFGGGWIRNKTGIHPRIISAIGVSVLSLFLYCWEMSAATGLAYLIFVSAPWGRWYSLGRVSRLLSGFPSYFETVLETISGYNNIRRDWLAFGMRNFIMAMPGIILVCIAAGLTISYYILPLSAGFGFAVVLLYETGWRLYERSATIQELCDIRNGANPLNEMLAGAFIGLLMIGGQYV